MATLRELLDAREDKTKPIKITRLEWELALFISIDDCSGGHSSDGTWRLYEEPKKKTKWYAYAEFKQNLAGEVKFFATLTPSNADQDILVRLPLLDLEVEE
jgi:hypothetical protein